MFGFIRNIWAGTSNKSARNSTQRRRITLAVEELTPRIVPSATPGTHFVHHQAVFPATIHSHTPANFAIIHHSHQNSADVGSGSSLQATLTDPTGASSATAKAEFNTVSGELEVHVHGATAGASLAVLVNGNQVGTIQADANGNGKLELTQANLGIQTGSTIAVDTLQGTFVAGNSSESETHTDSTLEATLTDPTGASSATARAEFNTVSGELEVHVHGAAAATSLDVLIDGNKVGSILTDANGNGKLELTQANLAIQAGSTTITIGTLQGTFAAGDSSENETSKESS